MTRTDAHSTPTATARYQERLPLLDGGSLPQVGLGTSKMLGPQAVRLFLDALADGFRLLDTASQYNNETAVGEAVRAAGVAREEIFVTTKIAGGDQGRAATRAGLQESLRKLGLDYVDLTLIHWPNPSRGLYRETWETLLELRDAGLTRHVGVANFLPAQITELINDTGELPVVNQIQLHPLMARRELTQFHRDHGIVTQPWRPLGPVEGLLEFPQVRQVAAELERSPAQVVLRWAVEHGYAPIAVSRKAERNRENLALADFSLSQQQLALLDSLDRGDELVWDPCVHEEW